MDTEPYLQKLLVLARTLPPDLQSWGRMLLKARKKALADELLVHILNNLCTYIIGSSWILLRTGMRTHETLSRTLCIFWKNWFESVSEIFQIKILVINWAISWSLPLVISISSSNIKHRIWSLMYVHTTQFIRIIFCFLLHLIQLKVKFNISLCEIWSEIHFQGL